MKAKRQHRQEKAGRIGNGLIIFVLLAAICMANVPLTFGTGVSTLLERLDLPAGMDAKDRPSRLIISDSSLCKTNASFYPFHFGTISSSGISVRPPSLSRLKGPDQLTIPASILSASGNQVRAPPRDLLFQNS